MAKLAGGCFETRAWRLPNLSDHGDKQQTWTLTTVCKEWESVEVRLRTTRYTWTYVTSCDNNPSQIPDASFHRFLSDRDRRVRWFSVSEMNESQLRVAVAGLFQAPSQWRCWKRTNGLLRSAPCMSVAVVSQKLQLLLLKCNNPAVKKQNLAEGCCTPVDIARQHRSRSYFNRFSLRVYCL